MKNISEIQVLFVDDESDTINGLKRFFRRTSYRKSFAASGAEALQALEKEPVDILVTDALMPQLNGPELIGIVKGRFPGVLCLLITGSNEIEQIVKSVGAGNLFGYITKPIDPEAFRSTIDSAVDHCRAARR